MRTLLFVSQLRGRGPHQFQFDASEIMKKKEGTDPFMDSALLFFEAVP